MVNNTQFSFPLFCQTSRNLRRARLFAIFSFSDAAKMLGGKHRCEKAQRKHTLRNASLHFGVRCSAAAGENTNCKRRPISAGVYPQLCADEILLATLTPTVYVARRILSFASERRYRDLCPFI
ncbi:Hypothetical_protein [Hexamita inflata]|uniref:Hypothetical_protein n=1 Tax=Hexamita inflata TaxID=28002 RepID=A0AA86QXF6_9EUKA|nr:Hypothetical protein HINF_LOCUS48939 [Hexamita inflata]